MGTKGIPLYFYPGLSLNFFRPRFLRKVVEWEPDVVHYVSLLPVASVQRGVSKLMPAAHGFPCMQVDPIWLAAQAQPILEYALPDVAAVSSVRVPPAGVATSSVSLTPSAVPHQPSAICQHLRIRLAYEHHVGAAAPSALPLQRDLLP